MGEESGRGGAAVDAHLAGCPRARRWPRARWSPSGSRLGDATAPTRSDAAFAERTTAALRRARGVRRTLSVPSARRRVASPEGGRRPPDGRPRLPRRPDVGRAPAGRPPSGPRRRSGHRLAVSNRRSTRRAPRSTSRASRASRTSPTPRRRRGPPRRVLRRHDAVHGRRPPDDQAVANLLVYARLRGPPAPRARGQGARLHVGGDARRRARLARDRHAAPPHARDRQEPGRPQEGGRGPGADATVARHGTRSRPRSRTTRTPPSASSPSRASRRPPPCSGRVLHRDPEAEGVGRPRERVRPQPGGARPVEDRHLGALSPDWSVSLS